MKLKTNIMMYLIFAGVLMGASYAKSNDGTKIKDAQNPIYIDLSAIEQQMLLSDQEFAFDFFSNIFNEEASGKNRNFMVSPFSLSMALAMTWNGAEGQTKSAMQKTLKKGNYSDNQLNSYYKKLKEAMLKTDPSIQLSIANSIWTNKFIGIKPDFTKVNKEYYQAEVKSVDFRKRATTKMINNWASDNTNGLIKHVIDQTNRDDLIYLLNAIYFKGMWANRFDTNNTSPKTFTAENGTQKQVDMMQQTAKLKYTADKNLQLVELPYGNQSFTMLILLPQKGKKLCDVITTLQNNEYWGSLKSQLSGAEVDLLLPKFKTEYSKIVNDVLIKMGMSNFFSDKADFSGISDYPARLSLVKQDTYINVDEKGTEAAAVTLIGRKSSYNAEQEKVIFNANKPFIYIIQENSTGAILFMGAVKNL